MSAIGSAFTRTCVRIAGRPLVTVNIARWTSAALARHANKMSAARINIHLLARRWRLRAAAGQHDFILAARWPFAFARRAIPLQGNRITANRLLQTDGTFGAARDARFGNLKGNGCSGIRQSPGKASARTDGVAEQSARSTGRISNDWQ